MKKSDLRQLYKQIKSRKKAMYSTSLFTASHNQTGCKSCGKVTWRPNQGD